MNKPGIKTTEFWTTLIAQTIGSVMLYLGYASQEEVDMFIKALMTALGSVTVIIATVIYWYGRIATKTANTQTGTQLPPLPMSDPSVTTVNPPSAGPVYVQ